MFGAAHQADTRRIPARALHGLRIVFLRRCVDAFVIDTPGVECARRHRHVFPAYYAVSICPSSSGGRRRVFEFEFRRQFDRNLRAIPCEATFHDRKWPLCRAAIADMHRVRFRQLSRLRLHIDHSRVQLLHEECSVDVDDSLVVLHRDLDMLAVPGVLFHRRDATPLRSDSHRPRFIATRHDVPGRDGRNGKEKNPYRPHRDSSR